MATSRAFSEESSREILLSLPVKSLLRFKCVCNNWGNFINNPSFTIDHLNLKRQIDNAILCTLWNPANREVRHLPATTISFEYFICDRHLVFGLDPMTKDYKVLYYTHRQEYATIYSCSRDSWKIFKHNLDVHQNASMCEQNIYNTVDYLNGSYYWLMNNNCRILSSHYAY
ncbi:hypothetical protein H5410_025301 [Solanum commersonii]|uniref:F-box domain-containing protein n=1 Tax=Solanum commersonii TaxID=4109 RepID=A0A9J5YTD8_SOLCO|nr:hypothetical protein H5410_025301 [Solanum commersonii]